MTRGTQRVVACVISLDDRLLVCQRPMHKRHGGLWEFPGGKTAPGETDELAAARELREELGVSLVRASAAAFEVEELNAPFVIAFVPVEINGDPVCLEHIRMIWDSPTNLLALALAPSDEAFVRFLVTSKAVSANG